MLMVASSTRSRPLLRTTASSIPVLPLERIASLRPRVARDDREILIAPHQRAQPGVFELLDTPDLGDDLTIAGKRLFGNGGDRLNVVQRAIGVEHNGFDAHGDTRPIGQR